MDLVTALEATDGVVTVVGAGGKKSTMFRLSRSIDRAVVTATVTIPIFDERVAAMAVTDDPVGAVDDATADDWPLGVVPEPEPGRDDRYLGYDPAIIDELSDHPVPDTILVKADGARMRKFKAPKAGEPVIPSSSTVVVPVVSAHVIGEPLSSEYVHRIDKVGDLTGLSPGQIMPPEAIAEVIASPDGGHKHVPDGATVIPVINMVDDAGLAQRARAVANAILEGSHCRRVVLTRLTADDPVVEVIT